MNYQASVSLRKFMFLPVLLAGLFLLFPLQARAQLGCDGVTVSMCYGAACQPYTDNQPKILPSQSPIHFDLVNAVAGETYSLLVEYEKIGSNVSQKIITKKVDGQVGQRVTVRDFLIADQYEYRDLFYFQEADAGETPGYKNLSLVAPDGKVCGFRTIETFTVDPNPQAATKCGSSDLLQNACLFTDGSSAKFTSQAGTTPPIICAENTSRCCQSNTSTCSPAEVYFLNCGDRMDSRIGTNVCTCKSSAATCCGYPSAAEPDGCAASDPAIDPGNPVPPGKISIACGQIFSTLATTPSGYSCTCTPSITPIAIDYNPSTRNTTFCCGTKSSSEPDQCSSSTGTGGGDGGGTGGATEEETEPTLDIFAGPNANDFKLLNPLQMFESPYADKFSSPAGIINRVLLFAFPLAGLILFVMIVWGGFEILSGATNSKGVQAGKQRITAALLGFGLLFVSFWIIQIVEYIFNLAIL